jgi:hypothetical protein
MNNVEYLIKIHDVSTDKTIEDIVKDYISKGITISKIEQCDTTKYTFYLEKTMNYNLFLDDERMPVNVKWVELPLVDWTIVRNYKQFVEAITANGLPQHISFDHDLADEHYVQSIASNQNQAHDFNYGTIAEKTGYDCAKWLVEYCREKDLEIPPYTVHSMSIIGKKNIIGYLENYKLWRINLK